MRLWWCVITKFDRVRNANAIMVGCGITKVDKVRNANAIMMVRYHKV